MTKEIILYCLILWINMSYLSSRAQEIDSSRMLLEERYLGQPLPGFKPQIFATGIVSSPEFDHSSPEFSKDGKTMLWTVVSLDKYAKASVYHCRFINGKWTNTEKYNLLGETECMYPTFALDNKRIYYVTGDQLNDIWYIEKQGDQYSKPIHVGFDSLCAFGFDVTLKGDLYFMAFKSNDPSQYDLYFSKFEDSTYSNPVKLSAPVNTNYYEDNPQIADDENWMIFESNRSGGFGNADIYLSVKNLNNTWGEPTNLGSSINTQFGERFGKFSPDKKYFFFGSNRNAKENRRDFDIFWMRSDSLLKFINSKVKEVRKI